MPYGSLLADTVQSSTSSPVTFKNTSGTEVGTLCRAWVNFNGTGTVAIRASFNVSSITDNGTGDYTVNFTNAMPDINYCSQATGGGGAGTNWRTFLQAPYVTPTTTALRLTTPDDNGTPIDTAYVQVAIFR
jgi:hypothetical protein